MADANAVRKPRKTSQTRQRKNRRTGHFSESENGLFDAAYEKYRNSDAASQYGESESAFIRWSTIGKGAKKLPKHRAIANLPPDFLAQTGRMITEMMRVGNNLNQIAKRMNAGGNVMPLALQFALEEFRETLRALKKLAGLER